MIKKILLLLFFISACSCAERQSASEGLVTIIPTRRRSAEVAEIEQFSRALVEIQLSLDSVIQYNTAEDFLPVLDQQTEAVQELEEEINRLDKESIELITFQFLEEYESFKASDLDDVTVKLLDFYHSSEIFQEKYDSFVEHFSRVLTP